MDFKQIKNLKMQTEDHYRKKANFYKTSPEYGEMVSRYPILKTSIKDCKGENLVK